MSQSFQLRGSWGPEGVQLAQDLHRLPEPVQAAVLVALQHRLGLEHLHKAAPVHSSPDPVSPELFVLLRAARRDWLKHGAHLVKRIRELLEQGRLLPLDDRNERLLRELFADHEVGIAVEFTGRHWDSDRVTKLVQQGLVRKDYAQTATLPISYRLGKGLEVLEPLQIADEQDPSLTQVVRRALAVDLDEQDHAAIRHVARKGAEFMRAPIVKSQTTVARVLSDEEYSRVRGAVAEGLRERRSINAIASDLEDATMGTRLAQDMDRVARTEVHAAQSQGAFEKLKRETSSVGMDDPLVYRQVDTRACKHCRRLFGEGRGAKPYRLSYVEANTLAGANFGRKADQWVPVIGPLHPQCRCAPWALWSQEAVDDVEAAADAIAAWIG